MKNTKGFTLIELAVVLAIIAVLAAVLTPMVINYLDQARVSRATADAKTIAQAVQLYRKDVGFYPVYNSSTNAALGTTDYNLLVGGLTGTTTATKPTYTGGGWSTLFGGTAGDIVTVLNTVPTGLSTNDKNPGKTSFRGPYIGALDTDPWGNPYIVANMTGANHAFVISAGPNGNLDTAVPSGTTGSVTASSDDIVAQIN